MEEAYDASLGLGAAVRLHDIDVIWGDGKFDVVSLVK
jgi:hypothetical protein